MFPADKAKNIPAAASAARDGLKVPNKLFEIITKSYNHHDELSAMVHRNATSKLTRTELGTTAFLHRRNFFVYLDVYSYVC